MRWFSILVLWWSFSFFNLTQAAYTLIPTEQDDPALASKFQNGGFQLYDIPQYALYLINKTSTLAGVLGVVFVMIGGYYYIIGAINGTPDVGKKHLQNVFMGLAFVAFAWMIIDIAVRFFTS